MLHNPGIATARLTSEGTPLLGASRSGRAADPCTRARSLIVVFACTSLVALVACLPRCALAGPCPFGIAPETAQRVFDRMKSLSLGDGYRFEGVATNDAGMVVQWSLNGEACPPIVAQVDTCWATFGLPSFQVQGPPELATRCPALQLVVRELGAAPPERQQARVGVIVLIAVAAALIRRVGWMAFLPVAAFPFLFNSYVTLTAGLGAAWLVFAVLLFEGDVVAGRSRAERLLLVALIPLSLVLDWSLSSGGPGDLRMNLAAIWSSGVELRWGPAPIALFRLVGFAAGGIQDDGIRWVNLILSSLLPILLYGIISELGVGGSAALCAALITAAHPLLIAFSGVLERQPTYLFAACGSTLALICFLKRGSWDRFLAFLLGAVLATTSRPEGAQVLILQLAVLLLVPASGRNRRCAAVALMVLVALAFAYVRYAAESTPPRGYPLMGQHPLLWTILFDPDFTPLAWIAAWSIGLVLGAGRRAAWVALATVLGVHIVWRWTGMYQMFVGHERQVASSRYETILLVPFAIGMALFADALLKARPALKAGVVLAFIAFTVATIRRPAETLLGPFTIDYEYRFLKKYASTLPPHARVFVLDAPVDDVGFIDAHLVGQFVGSPVRFQVWSERQCDDLIDDSSPTFLYIGSSCAELTEAPGRALSQDYRRWMDDCSAIRARVAGDPVELIDVPGRKMSWNDFKNPTVPLGLYRVKDPSLCALGPHAAHSRAPALAQS
jgi:hypothetical protein